jgi:hypothetical protein
MVPTLTWGLVRSNLAFAMAESPPATAWRAVNLGAEVPVLVGYGATPLLPDGNPSFLLVYKY